MGKFVQRFCRKWHDLALEVVARQLLPSSTDQAAVVHLGGYVSRVRPMAARIRPPLCLEASRV